MGSVSVPSGYGAALKSPQREHWLAAIAKELEGLIALNTWELVPHSSLPAGANVMRCHFVFDLKRTRDGAVEKFKARREPDCAVRRPTQTRAASTGGTTQPL